MRQDEEREEWTIVPDIHTSNIYVRVRVCVVVAAVSGMCDDGGERGNGEIMAGSYEDKNTQKTYTTIPLVFLNNAMVASSILR
jgi:hypothetical protein